jgi:hypothetical protein
MTRRKRIKKLPSLEVCHIEYALSTPAHFSNLLEQPRLQHTVVNFRRPLFVATSIQLALDGIFGNYRYLANRGFCPYGVAVSRKSHSPRIT